jgi:hypothetical protein
VQGSPYIDQRLLLKGACEAKFFSATRSESIDAIKGLANAILENQVANRTDLTESGCRAVRTAGARCAWPNVAPNEHERQHHISPGGTQTNRPCQYGGDHPEFHVFTIRSRRGHFAHRTTQRVLWSTDCKSPAMAPRYGTRLAVDHGSNACDPFWACNTNSAQRRGAPTSRYVSTVKP